MGLKSRQKGKRGERAWVQFLREIAGLTARRGLSQSGGAIEADVVCEETAGIHWEVKIGKRQPNLDDAMAQAKRDAPEGTIPVVAHKKDFASWMVTLPAEDYLKQILGDLPETTTTTPTTQADKNDE